MNILVLSGNPKKDGLCQSVIDQAVAGARDGGAHVEEIRLCESKLLRCAVCGDGWGICKAQHVCVYGNDGFSEISEKIAQADAVIIATPVYWWEVSEALKSFMDRFRRCNYGEKGRLSGKQTLLIASAGGTGNGILHCMEELEQFCKHTGAPVFDMIGVNRWSGDYKRAMAYAAVKAMAQGRKNGDSL